MTIIHKIDDFLYTIFPQVKKGDTESLVDSLEKYYTYGPFKPKVKIDNDFVVIDVDTSTIATQDEDYKRTVAYCEKGRFNEAKQILSRLIEKDPTNSEYHRIMGQILSEEGDQEEAINCLIDALRWDSKNHWALLMMGNIFAKFKDDLPTAMKYYDQVLVADPGNSIAINNIAANLMQQGNFEEAKKYFWEAMKANDTYPNTHYALGMIAEREGDLQSAFFSTTQALRLNKNRDALYQNSIRQAFEVAEKIIKSDTGKKIVERYKQTLEKEGGKKIEIIEDSNIPFAAKIEIAENYNRQKHIVKYKPHYPAIDHLIMHELVHLDFVIAARKEDSNELFISNQSHKSAFIRSLERDVNKLNKSGFSEESVANYLTQIFEGINSQVYNTPIDLFIENFLYEEYPELRAYQFFSLFTLIQDGIKAVTDKKSVKLSPNEILSKSKIYNIVLAFQFRDLYGIDLINDFKATTAEQRHAKEFYDEYLEYKDDKEPAEEYELVQHWAEDLQLDKNFELVDENVYRSKTTNIDNLLTSIEEDPFGTDIKDPFKERQMEKFHKSQKEIGTNMAVVMYMVDALQYFEGMPKDKIKNIAFEIAMNGTQGYAPDGKDYRINSISGKTFTGYHILAYYYISWKLAIPEMVSQLNLPYDNEYELALTIYDSKK